jgi:hypothetical protein
MSEGIEFALRTLLIGIGATAVLDLWSVLLHRAFKFPAPNMAMVGRWIGYFPRGRFVHDSIAAATPIARENAIGWIAHYVIGVIFAAALIAICGLEWAREPTPLPAILFGVVTVAAPLFVLQPGMGGGIAASRAPKPNVVRLRSLMNHTVFGVGLYLAVLIVSLLMPS